MLKKFGEFEKVDYYNGDIGMRIYLGKANKMLKAAVDHEIELNGFGFFFLDGKDAYWEYMDTIKEMDENRQNDNAWEDYFSDDWRWMIDNWKIKNTI